MTLTKEEKKSKIRDYHREYYSKNKEKIRAYHRKYYNENRSKKDAVEYMGGKCVLCGYSKCIAALDFHHRNPEEKEFNFKWNAQKSRLSKIVNELDKCILLCANCHREVHYNTDLLNKLRIGGAAAWETVTSV